MHAANVNIHRIWNETLNRLETFRARVQENRDVMAASEFARWLFFSGLIELFKANAQDGFFKVDGCLIESKVETLLSMCNDRFRTNDQETSFQKSEFESLREKIDRMAGYLAKLSVAPAVAVAPAPESDGLKIISGGLDETLHNGERLRPQIETPGQKLIGVNGSANSERCRNGAAQGKQ